MMIPERPALERRVLAALDGRQASPRASRSSSAAAAAAARRCCCACATASAARRASTSTSSASRRRPSASSRRSASHRRSPPSPHAAAQPAEAGAREAFDATLAFLDTARAAGGGPATFLLDEFLELRTFESFPGLRRVLRDLLDALAASGNRFVLTSATWRARSAAARRAGAVRGHPRPAADASGDSRRRCPRRSTARGAPNALREAEDERARDELARLVQALSDGRPVVRAADRRQRPPRSTPRGARSRQRARRLLAPDGALVAACRFCYELRLHRARGYGALKAILESSRRKSR